MLEGVSADMCAGKCPLVSMGAEWRVLHVQNRRRGSPSALTEIQEFYLLSLCSDILRQYKWFGWNKCRHREKICNIAIYPYTWLSRIFRQPSNSIAFLLMTWNSITFVLVRRSSITCVLVHW
jgi:hypothetical protein